MNKQPILFCDFDGTVTANDNIIAIMKHFDPPGWRDITDRILGQRISVKEGVGELFSLFPSSDREAVTSFVLNQAVIRDGFEIFVDNVKQQEVPLFIVSGGIDFFVHPLLQPYPLEGSIFCNGSDFSKENIRITWPHPCGEGCTNGCGLCKVTILESYPADTYDRIVIGDSITDLAAAKRADFVIARDFLLEKCEELGLSHASFETFHDVLDILREREVIV